MSNSPLFRKNMKTGKYLNITTAIAAFIVALNIATAQPATQNESVTVIGQYTPELSEARKIGFTPQLKDTVIPVPPIDYKIVSVPIETVVDVKPIPPAKMVGESFQKLYKNHIIAGVGNYLSPYLDYSHHSYRSKKLRGEIHLKHLSGAGKIQDYAFPGYSENNAGLSGHFIQNNYTFSSGMDYTRDAVHYYGFTPDTLLPDFDKKDIRQVFKKLDFFAGGSSNYLQKDKWHNSFMLRYQGLWDSYEVNEQNALFSGKLQKRFSLASFFSDESFNLEAKGGMFAQNYALQDISTGLAELKPYLKFSLSELSFTVGAKAIAQLDSVGEFLFFPYGRLDINIVPEALKIFMEVDGQVERNTFRDLTELNPFMNTEIVPLHFTYTRNILSGGISGGFGGKYNYRLMAKNRQIENLPLFINDTLAFMSDTNVIAMGNRFDIVYDNVDILTFSVELQMNFSKKFALEIFGGYHIFSTETQAKAWHMPRYEGILRAIYNLDDKIYAKVNVFAFGDRYAPGPGDTEIALKPVYDFSLELEYRFTKQLGFWGRFNNFTTKRHFYWNNYPSQRMNVMFGASYTF
jgi:hypothetical protein